MHDLGKKKNNNAAILYVADEYHTAKNRIMGRHSANEGFLSAYAKYASRDVAYSYVANENQYKGFCQQYRQLRGNAGKIVGIPHSQPQELKQAGCLYVPDPNLAQHAYVRRSLPQANADLLYSLCGVTHTVSSDGAMQLVRDLLLSPVKPWDALICTSIAVKDAIENIIAVSSEYYAERFNNTCIKLECQLPIIPLGVNTQQYAVGAAREKLREQWRSKLNIAGEDVVILFLGRLSFHAKANPLPMFSALEIAGRKTGKKLHLLQVGQFATEGIKKAFHEAEKMLCPSVQYHYLDGGDAVIRQQAWYTADIFTSLADNIQETFGLTPIEAMAASLPVVISDWDGYRDTVNHGVQGFLIPTTMPAAQTIGINIAERFYHHVDNYDHYLANAASFIGVDTEATAHAYVQLIESKELRIQMGEAGRARAEQVYDWRHIIAAYQDLWSELAAIREREMNVRPHRTNNQNQITNPLALDPYYIFNGYPTIVLDMHKSLLSIGDVDDMEKIRSMLSLGILDSKLKEPWALYQQVMGVVQKNNPCRLQDVVTAVDANNRQAVLRVVSRLIKMGGLRCTDS